MIAPEAAGEGSDHAAFSLVEPGSQSTLASIAHHVLEPVGVDLPGFSGERLAHFPGLSLEDDWALEAER